MLSSRALAGLGLAHLTGVFLAHLAALPRPLPAPEEAPPSSFAEAELGRGAEAPSEIRQVLDTLQEALGDCLATRAPVCPNPCPECRCDCGTGAVSSWWRAALEFLLGAFALLALELVRAGLGWLRHLWSAPARPAARPALRRPDVATGAPDPRVPRGGGQYR